MLLDVLHMQLEQLLLKLVFLTVDLSEIILHELLDVDILVSRASSGPTSGRDLPSLRALSTLCTILVAHLRVLSLDAIHAVFLLLCHTSFFFTT